MANGEVLLGSEDFSAEDKQFGQSGHGAGVSAKLLEHGKHETMVLCTSLVVWLQPQPQQLGVCMWWRLLCTDSLLAILSMFPGLTLHPLGLIRIDLVWATVNCSIISSPTGAGAEDGSEAVGAEKAVVISKPGRSCFPPRPQLGGIRWIQKLFLKERNSGDP